MIAGMDDSKKYVIINYQSPEELDKPFDEFMGNWLWTAICIQRVVYYPLKYNNINWNFNIFLIFLWIDQKYDILLQNYIIHKYTFLYQYF